MKIIKFTAENVKRLKAVEITPDGSVQVISGRNAQGKSSVLDAIWLALGGGPAARATSQPVRDGEDTARVSLDLGDFVVTRTWKGDKTTLTVRLADGQKVNSPQSILDKLVGRLSFDPLEFTRQTSAAQRDALMSIVDLPFDPEFLDGDRARIYDLRTEVGRQSKLIGFVKLPESSMPLPELSATDLFAEIQAARFVEQTERDQRSWIAKTEAEIRLKTVRIEAQTAKLAELTAEVAERSQALETATASLEVAPEGILERLEVRMAGLEVANEQIRESNRNLANFTASEELNVEYEALTEEIDRIDHEKADGLRAAVFPVDGLGFDATGVTYNGIPFSQASSAEQIQVSLAMAMNLNPTLRVIRIMDGSLLDADSLAAIAAAASAADYQVWIERVGDDGAVGAVVIEDGEIRETTT
jgi:DNA repair exonuclease SbcCD ATPase subunit